MEPPKPHDILLFILVVALAGVGWNLQTQVQQMSFENERFREMLPTQATCPEVLVEVQVACECPKLDDELYSHPSLEELEHLCAEYEEYGYLPGC